MGLNRPERDASRTNVTRAEAVWRSSRATVTSLEVVIDVGRSPARDAERFAVTSTIGLKLREPATTGVWIDFIGDSVECVRVDDQDVEPVWDGARIELPPLAAGSHAVTVDAVGRFSRSGQGLHRFVDPVDGATYVYTHFEPSDARRAWPCLDQPDLKAPFTLRAIHPASWTVLSNGVPHGRAPVSDCEDLVETAFAPTPPVPSYLTAFAGGPWHRVSGQWRSSRRPQDGPVGLSWSCRASLARHLDADELLTITASGMDLFDTAYDYPYPWGSYDSVLVPEYNLGAMENPGCVTFNEEAYLFRGPSTRSQRGGRANTILHEMSHMWFGDLVTPRWWEDTWLKESFADHQGTWAQAEATEYTEAWVSFALDRKAWAYREDSRPATTHPIVARVDDVEAARQAFDGITYAKGAAVLKQLVAHVGFECFQAAVRAWFAEHAFSTGDLAEFLQTLSRASGRDMEAWADAWLRTCGPSVLRNELDVAGGRIKRLVVHQQGSDPSTGRRVLRPHTFVVGLYSFDDGGALVRTHRLPMTLEGGSAEVPGAVGLPAPDLVTVNDEDLTYAVVRPDRGSVTTALTSLHRLSDPLTEAVWWSALHNLQRDGLLAAADYVAAVLVQTGGDARPVPATTLTTLLRQARVAAVQDVEPAQRGAVVAMLAGAGESGPSAWSLLVQSQAGSDTQLVRARSWIEAAGQTLLVGPSAVQEAEERLRWLLDGGLDGLVIDDDLRWTVLTSLSRLGRIRAGELEAAAAADPSASGVTHYLRAASSSPSQEVKERVFTRILEDASLSNDHLDALLEGFAVDSHRELTAPFTARYLGALDEMWRDRPQEVATSVVLGLFPACGGQEDLEAVNAWLASHEPAPAALRRLVLGRRDELARSLQARRTRSDLA